MTSQTSKKKQKKKSWAHLSSKDQNLLWWYFFILLWSWSQTQQEMNLTNIQIETLRSYFQKLWLVMQSTNYIRPSSGCSPWSYNNKTLCNKEEMNLWFCGLSKWLTLTRCWKWAVFFMRECCLYSGFDVELICIVTDDPPVCRLLLFWPFHSLL